MYHGSIKYNPINRRVSKKKRENREDERYVWRVYPGRKRANRVDASEPPVSCLINPYEKDMMYNAVVFRGTACGSNGRINITRIKGERSVK